MIHFEILTHKDIPLLTKWLNTKHVKDFWDENPPLTKKKIISKYDQRIRERKVLMYIMYCDGVAIGYIQSYKVHEEELKIYSLSSISYGIDLYIGNPDYLNKGYASHIISLFIKNIVFPLSAAVYICIDPETSNKKAIHVYEKVGFRHKITAYNKSTKSLTYYMLLSRKEFLEKNC